jgi:hypothetical protein
MADEEPEFEEEDDEDEKGKASDSTESKITDADSKYLETLSECEQQAIDEFDKALLKLSAGAFGISFVFLKEITKSETITCKTVLELAWLFWGLTLGFSLLGFFASHQANRNAQVVYMRYLKSTSPGRRRKTINYKKLRGKWGITVEWLNPLGGICFILGLICMSFFVTNNLSHDPHPSSRASSPTTNTTPATAAATIPTNNASSNAPATRTISNPGPSP